MQMRPLLAISFLFLCALASPLNAQEAPGEDVPGMRIHPDLPIAPPPPPPPAPAIPSKELSPQERQGLNNLFKGKLEEEKKNPAPTSGPNPSLPPDFNANSAPGAISPEPEIIPLQNPALYMNTAHLLKFTILNKQTTRQYNQELTAGSSLTFGPLTIKLIECWRSSPDTTPSSAALLQITEARPDTKRKPLFLGWMFANTPSLNPLEHPVYDITIKECR